MRSATLFSPHALAEREVARMLEQLFGAAWFPEYHRCSIEGEDGFVAVDVDPEYAARLEPEEQRRLAVQLGFIPRTALHIQSSAYHSGSASLAEQVGQQLCRHFDGKASAAA